MLHTAAGTQTQIVMVQRWTVPKATVLNLTVSALHTYYVVAGETPVLVHNSNGKGCGVGGSGISARNKDAGDIGNYTDG
ncbi:hypothetical protein ACIQOU_04340 [Streptomyces sp. NPDC091279]|uniref:hypothetical protein n=1 Tax=Streptomyces sp. NPDC091279 TaxID=3365983 RepID=UPI0037F15393